MDSTDLIRTGFKRWLRFNLESEQFLLSNLPTKFGVYVIRKKHHFGRFIGDSDISYIGSATNMNGLKNRIRQYYHPGPTQRTNRRILKLLTKIDDFELSFLEVTTTAEAKELEKHLLQKYDNEHGELPPLNRQG